VNAALSLPIVSHGDAAYISRLDLNTLVHPVLYPGRPEKTKKVTKVVLDPGHGGKDPGNEAAGAQEKKQTLLLAKEVQKRLSALGIKGVLTRSSDSYVDNHDRPGIAKKLKADLFISLHYNSVPSGRSDANGSEVYCLTPAGAASTNDHGESGPHGRWPGNGYDDQNVYLAYLLQKSITGLGSLNDRGLKRARYTVLCNAEMPAVLIEAGFMSDPEEARRIGNQTYRRQVALSIVDGILAFKRYIDRPAPAKLVAKAKASKSRR
jgi:N-acetylmuramoyl-L-alanine amidase